MSNAVYSAKRERSVGLGAMGFHSFLQKKGIPFESALAKSWNIKFFKHIKKKQIEHLWFWQWKREGVQMRNR